MTAEGGLRVDVVLHRLCLMRSRSEAGAACAAEAVSVDGRAVRASRLVVPGQTITIRYPTRTLALELLELPGKSTSKKAAREMYRVLSDERTGADAV